MDAASHETVLSGFTGGANPIGSIARDAAGNLYGATSAGTNEDVGVLYKVNATGQQTALLNFGSLFESTATSGVVLDSSGNLYGVAILGGLYGGGGYLVYKTDAASGYTVWLYTFTGGADGASPSGDLTLDAAGNLYGTTTQGGAAGQGVVYAISPSGQETVLYSFTGGADGGDPATGVILDSSGNLYGTTSGGGAAGNGTVFKLDAAGQKTVLYSFKEPPSYDVEEPPYSRLAIDAAGNLYGTSYAGGGTGCGEAGCGTVYKVDQSGRYTLLHSFTGGDDGSKPSGPVLLDGAGHLFGTASAGGKRLGGVLFVITL